MLYRPSYMIPSLYVADGDGIIDAKQTNTFSAKINGRAPVVAYQCGIFKNNTTSDIVYDSGVVKLASPFYGADSKGNIIPFTYEVPQSVDSMDNYTTNVVYDSSSYKYTVTLDDKTLTTIGFKIPQSIGVIADSATTDSGVITLSYTNGFTYESGIVVGFACPQDISSDATVSIKIDSTEYSLASHVAWTSGNAVYLSLQNAEDTYTATEVANTIQLQINTDTFTTSPLLWKTGDVVFVDITTSEEDMKSISINTSIKYTTMENGYIYGYKYILTLWWDLDESDYTKNCIDSFETVFYAKETPSVVINSFSDETDSNGFPIVRHKSCEFNATYSQANNTGIAWFGWTLAEAENRENIVDQTGRIYTNSPLSYSFDGLSTGKSYSIMLELRNQDGVYVTSGWVDFYVSYEVVELKSAVVVSATEDDGVLVDWGQLQYVKGQPNNNNYRYLKPLPTILKTCVELLKGNTITFTSSEHFDVSIPLEAEHIWSGCLLEDSNEIYYAEGVDDNGNKYYMRLSHLGSANGLYPSETLYPNETLYPATDIGGYFLLDINGEKTYTVDSGFIESHWFVVRMCEDGLHVHEAEFDRSLIDQATIIYPT